jgi:serine/threonine protein phosphatase PrpC
MNYLSAYRTDVGIKKKTNQDSLYLVEAETVRGHVLLAAVCDGMGGLASGELASAVLCQAFATWFKQQLPALIAYDSSPEAIKASMENLLLDANENLLDYSSRKHLSLGTTACALLLIGPVYYVINIGDSRLYELSDALYQITRDQTVVQREIDTGILTPEAAEKDSRRNVLLQCIGASAIIEPAFTSGLATPGSVFLLCSDGFRHVVSPREIWDALNPQALHSEDQMEAQLTHLIELNKYRREEDNISALAVRLPAESAA